MNVGLIVHANKWTGAAAVAEINCRALRAAGVDARLLFIGGRNLERRLTGRSWAEPVLVKEGRPAHVRANLRAVTAFAAACDIVVCHLPHDHLLCVAAGVHRSASLVRAFRNPRHIRRDPFHRFLDRRTSGTLLAHSGMRATLGGHAEGPRDVALPVPLDDRFVPCDGSRWRRDHGIPADVPVVGSVGKLARGRGFSDLLEAASQLTALTHVVVVGHGEHLSQLQERAAHLGFDGRVHWTGYQDQDLPEIYAAMDVVVFLAPGSDWGHRSISEAQGCGRPVVAASWPGVPDLIEDHISGRIVDRDPREIAAAVQSLLADRAAARRLADTAAAAADDRRLIPVGRHLAGFLETILRQ